MVNVRPFGTPPACSATSSAHATGCSADSPSSVSPPWLRVRRQRTGNDRDDSRVRVFTGCVLGAVLAAVYGNSMTTVEDPPPMMSEAMMGRVDEALGLLEDGLPL